MTYPVRKPGDVARLKKGMDLNLPPDTLIVLLFDKLFEDITGTGIAFELPSDELYTKKRPAFVHPAVRHLQDLALCVSVDHAARVPEGNVVNVLLFDLRPAMLNSNSTAVLVYAGGITLSPVTVFPGKDDVERFPNVPLTNFSL